jgi:hypothetical protein
VEEEEEDVAVEPPMLLPELAAVSTPVTKLPSGLEELEAAITEGLLAMPQSTPVFERELAAAVEGVA